MVDISVVITFYNQDYNKLFQSLYSVIRQKDISFEIVITYNGSRDFIKDFFE
jgi:glycosyltransferase involved in cell wall biosynthesis